MYKDKTDSELIELLTKYKKLTFQSQIHLLDEISHRNIQDSIVDLKIAINKTKKEIENLDYLKNLGFKAEKLGNSIRITRTQKAVLTDIVASVLGIVFCLIGIFGVFGLIGSFSSESEFSMLSLIIQIGRIVIGTVGVSFLNGIKRLINYAGFKLENSNGTITLKKRFDAKLVEIQKSQSLLELKEQSGVLTLYLENHAILSANTNNIIHKTTISELTSKLKTAHNN